jgi:hypothetical protein
MADGSAVLYQLQVLGGDGGTVHARPPPVSRSHGR